MDGEGNAYVTGYTMSADFPTTAGALQRTYKSSSLDPAAAFVFKLNPTGTGLVYSTLLGTGSTGNAIAVDAAGQAVVTGNVAGDLPLKEAMQTTNQNPAQMDAFVTKLNATGTDVIFSTYMGSSYSDTGLAVALDKTGNVYVLGEDGDGDIPFPTTPGAYATTHPVRTTTMFIAKFEPRGKLVYSTLFPYALTGPQQNFTQTIAADDEGCVYFSSADMNNRYPTTPGAYQTANPMGECCHNLMMTLTKLSADGSRLIYSTYVPTDVDQGFGRPGGMAIDADKNVYLAANGAQLFKINPQGSKVLYKLDVYGGVQGLAIDSEHNVYLTGYASAGLPTSLDAFQPTGPTQGGAAFVMKVTEAALPPRPTAFNIRGTIVFRSGQAPYAPYDGVKVLLQGAATRTAITDSQGGYLFENLPAGGDYTVVPDPAGYVALPSVANVTKLNANQVLNFEVSNKETRFVSHVSAASYKTGPLAAESIVSAFGSNLATFTQAVTEFPLPTDLRGIKVHIKDSAGFEKIAELLFVSPTQINYVLPSALASGAAIVTITGTDGSASKELLQIDTTTPGLFTADSTGQGIAAANVQRVKADGKQTTEDIVMFDPLRGKMVALPIDLGPADDKVYLALYGTGIRNRRTLTGVTATVGGLNAAVSYAGAQIRFVGLDQINVLIPHELAGRGDVEVVLAVEGKVANTVRVKIK